jgi:hypothetical protein
VRKGNRSTPNRRSQKIRQEKYAAAPAPYHRAPILLDRRSWILFCTSNISLSFRLLLLLLLPANAKILRVQLNSKWRVFFHRQLRLLFLSLSLPSFSPTIHPSGEREREREEKKLFFFSLSLPILRRRFPSASLPSSTSVMCF